MAVFTNLSDNDFREVLKNYDIGVYAGAKGILDGIENTNYILTTDRNKYIFTIYENRTNISDLPFFLGLTEELNKNNFRCPVPVRNKNGELTGKFKDKNFAIISFLEGRNIKFPTLDEIKKAAAKLAQLHNCSLNIKDLYRQNSLGRDFWLATYSKVKDQAEKEFPELKDLAARAFDMLKNKWPEELDKGIIHGDYFPDNVMFKENGDISGVIDFYMACNDILAYDLAIMINAWCFEKDFSYNKEKAKILFENYNSVRKVSDNEIKSLNTLLVGSSIRFLVTRLYDYFNRRQDAEVTVKDPREYISKLKLHLSITDPKEYGF